MAISRKMLAVLKKVDAARAEHYAGLRASAERDAEQGARTEGGEEEAPPRTRKSPPKRPS
jgi:hypothetical protein